MRLAKWVRPAKGACRNIPVRGLYVMRQLHRRYSSHRTLIPSHAMIPFAFPIFLEERPQSAPYRKRANRLALGLFTLTALVGVAVKYLV